jgi:pSer/pThr/pTyr-binding forkhead associated (FHA) protein
VPARLIALDQGSDIVLNGRTVVVGRHPACDARLESLRVSRHHCCITRENGNFVVRDLGSTNGIRINGLRVDSGHLVPGDELAIAHLRYRLEDRSDPDSGGSGRTPMGDLFSPNSRIAFIRRN